MTNGATRPPRRPTRTQVVDLGGGDYVELMAHRYWFRTEEQAETHYDEIIETIIPTLERRPR